MRKFIIIFIFFIFSRPIWGENPTLSISYFEDLSITKEYSSFSKAFTAILISDFARVDGLQLVEREDMEKILKEMELSLTGLVDDQNAPRLGKIMGVNYMISGNFLVEEKNLLVNYKIIRVENARIESAGKVKGDTDHILKIQSSLFTALVQDLKKLFPDIRIKEESSSDAEVDLDKVRKYGQALDFGDNGEYTKAEEVLKNLLGEIPDFQYAKEELIMLREKIKKYDMIREKLLEEEVKNKMTWETFNKVAMNYTSSMRYSKLFELCQKVRKNPPSAPEGSMITTLELVDYYLSFALYSLKKYNKFLVKGEQFLKMYPTSMYYQTVRTYLNQAIKEVDRKKKVKKQVDIRVKELLKKSRSASPEDKNYLYYQIATEYFQNQFYENSLTYYKKINLKMLQKKYISPDTILYQIFMCYYYLFNKDEARKVYKTMQTFYPDSTLLDTMSTFLDMFPE